MGEGLNTQQIEDYLIVLKSRLSERINQKIKQKRDKEFHNLCVKRGALDNAIRQLQELNKYGVEAIE